MIDTGVDRTPTSRRCFRCRRPHTALSHLDPQCPARDVHRDSSFDVVVSCLTFHEIGDVARKSDGAVEALRVLRPGGRYVFLDLFGDPAFYPSLDDVRDAIATAGGSIVEFSSLVTWLPLPFPLRHPKVLGHAMLIVGAKPGIGVQDGELPPCASAD